MWIEFLHLRTPKADSEVLDTLNELIQARPEIEGLKEIHLFQHARYPGDFGIILIWESDCQQLGSLYASYLTEFLSTLGAVDHAVWVGIQVPN